MSRWSSLPHRLLLTLATVFSAAAIVYASFWMYIERTPGSKVELGFNSHHANQYDGTTHCLKVGDVVPNSPAERAGLRAGDRIIGVNGQALTTSRPFDQAYAKAIPGDAVTFTVQRAGEPSPLEIRGIFRESFEDGPPEGLAKSSAVQVTRSFPVLFLLVGLAVLFLRLNDPNAWLLASLFCGFVAEAGFSHQLTVNALVRTFALSYQVIFSSMLCPLFYIFFAVFPARAPLDRRVPWLKWIVLAIGVAMALTGVSYGDLRNSGVAADLFGQRAGDNLRLSLIYVDYVFIALGLISLAGNTFAGSSDPGVRRKSRVIFWGTLIGVLPMVIERAAMDFAGYHPSFWVNTVLIIVCALYPLSFGYAVVKHRVMEIPVLLRRSARYFLVQRGFTVLLFVVAFSAIAFFSTTLSRFFQPNASAGMMFSAAFGIALVWAAAPLVKRGTQRIDRAFFRSAYDARLILQDLAEKARTVTSRGELAELLRHHLDKALRPKNFVCYFVAGDSKLVAECGNVPPGAETLSTGLMTLALLTLRGRSWDVPLPGEEGIEDLAMLAPLAPECLVPILDHAGQLSGLLVLGERLSEEPYSSEDKRLLDSVASQAGIAIENFGLAEKMAERMEVDRRVARDMEIAREVQSRLFPQFLPPLQTLQYTGTCIQARVVGGDYYDFLDLGTGRLGIVLADISGKGIAAALLMANLQANLRSRFMVALEDPHQLLQSVNQLFVENTPEDSYATLFYADYDDANHCLRYANCGHNPPLLLRANGEIERLEATATVLGLFTQWNCEVKKIAVGPGDVLVIYTDGVTEAPNDAGEEFGESRLMKIVRAHPQLPVKEMLSVILDEVQQFSGASQADDLTLVIARAQ
ncbi:MAG TPA: SpoIIE family protein phosphatase [Candidatus Sulfotelmatobacter sp.]|jgi:sigma-B regulation protein RsbU (phosphoserine phosphatase)|nr:SpoIIE family protein phosphatase [Candidatus Sulfotelmatobacter sp.]